MIVAFCLYKYFPFGGLQRDFMRIAQTVAARGHQVRVYTQSWEGECPQAFELIKVPVKSHTNHGRNAQYYTWVQNHLHEHPVGRLEGLVDVPERTGPAIARELEAGRGLALGDVTRIVHSTGRE